MFLRLCWICLLLPWLMACKNDLAKARELANTDEAQMDVAVNVRMVYKENGQIIAVISAPTMHTFFRNENRLVFPEGLAVELYDQGEMTCNIQAGYGQRDETTKRMTASKGVVVMNNKGERLESEDMIWDEVRAEIKVDGKVKITTPTDQLTGYGLLADDRFRNYSMKKITGVVQVKDDNIPGR